MEAVMTPHIQFRTDYWLTKESIQPGGGYWLSFPVDATEATYTVTGTPAYWGYPDPTYSFTMSVREVHVTTANQGGDPAPVEHWVGASFYNTGTQPIVRWITCMHSVTNATFNRSSEVSTSMKLAAIHDRQGSIITITAGSAESSPHPEIRPGQYYIEISSQEIAETLQEDLGDEHIFKRLDEIMNNYRVDVGSGSFQAKLVEKP
ncbi:hypothetical protein ACFC1R_03435 [Kitasatospora sp. NPDC056138]|uniref:hypothetical protein n=1 Tax=Kitasatospora sp. NPDC056138 TaxID=3345724 RepID=UPI0035D9E032